MPIDQGLIQSLAKARSDYQGISAVTTQLAHQIGTRSLALIFPQFSQSAYNADHEIELELLELQVCLARFIGALASVCPNLIGQEARLMEEFAGKLLTVRSLLLEDAEATFNADPAAESVDEIILSYPGFLATSYYRIAHELRLLGIPLLPRLLSQEAQHQTGVDIHPGAVIGRKLSIDHGIGVVIGGTAVIGNGVKLYQGVTLGALAVDRTMKDVKRHPTIGDNVVIYANATILGGDTVIGHDSIIGGNAWITASIPSFSVVNRQNSVRMRTDSREELLEFLI